MASRNGRKYFKDEDFEEEEIWGVMEENRENSSTSPKLRKPFKKNSSLTEHFTSASPRMIPRSSSSSSSSSEKQSSAPVEIPDWSKIYGMSSSNKKNNAVNHDVCYDDVDHVYGCYGDGDHVNGCYHDDDGGYDDDGDGDGDGDGDDMVPPHEFLAQKLARSQISSFSVYEGIGRTLKGRDLSKVRNAILTKTGFLE